MPTSVSFQDAGGDASHSEKAGYGKACRASADNGEVTATEIIDRHENALSG
ncbi:hypothetical protein Pen02_81830 [Plantactinospora endophytica]|uniref:Uncharacterized protein n=1 Tax=Plantactinospora endophytica TaxID=673535 RepID=A0ABQ4EET5_9ACTN|nr:hypothetical protein Pen02_81830 [Plantactinospora endophytica]